MSTHRLSFGAAFLPRSIAAVAALAVGGGGVFFQSDNQVGDGLVPLLQDEIDFQPNGLASEVEIQRKADVQQKQKSHPVLCPNLCFTSVTVRSIFEIGFVRIPLRFPQYSTYPLFHHV